jgi:uncharacterized RDD family membrane protein YckC
MSDEHRDSEGITARLGRMALGPARAAARSGRAALSSEAENAIDGILAGPLPETVARSLVEHRVVERMLTEWLEAMTADARPRSAESERLERAVEEALASPAMRKRLSAAVASPMTETLAEEVVRSAAFKQALAGILESPEVRNALARQTMGYGSEIAASLRGWARALDDAVGKKARRLFGRGQAGADAEFGGLTARGIAIVLDAVLVHIAFFVAAGSIALILSLAGSFHSGWLTDSLLSAAWTVIVVVYFVGFWATTGQTPGMRLLRLRVLARSGKPPSAIRALVRFVGLILAIIPLFAGFLPVLFDDRRRALQDYLAGTAVAAEPDD